MAVPKKKTSSSKTKIRRSHIVKTLLKVAQQGNATEQTTGNVVMPHRMDLETGYYKGRLVRPPKQKKSVNSEE